MENFETYRPLLFSIAYRMLGSAMDAEDIVQEAYLRYQTAAPEEIRSLKSFLSTIVTRLSINHLKSARVQRESYSGPWLPEPVLVSDDASWVTPEKQMSDYESISIAFLVLLESLSPVERAVFVLRQVFDYEYVEIARITGKSEEACRQSFSRAKKHISANRPRFESSPEEHQMIVNRFMEAVGIGELDGLTSLLAESVTFQADGGGKVRGAALHPLHGPESVAKFVLNSLRFSPEGSRDEVSEVNGKAAIVIRTREGVPFTIINLEVEDGQICGIYVIANPDKLKRV